MVGVGVSYHLMWENCSPGLEGISLISSFDFFLRHFIIKVFKLPGKLDELLSEHSRAHTLDFTVTSFFFYPVSIHLSIHEFDCFGTFQSKLHYSEC